MHWQRDVVSLCISDAWQAGMCYSMFLSAAEEGGFCVGPGECMCREGFSGENCTISKS